MTVQSAKSVVDNTGVLGYLKFKPLIDCIGEVVTLHVAFGANVNSALSTHTASQVGTLSDVSIYPMGLLYITVVNSLANVEYRVRIIPTDGVSIYKHHTSEIVDKNRHTHQTVIIRKMVYSQ